MNDKGHKKTLRKFSTNLFLISLLILAVVIISLAVDFKFQLIQYKEVGEQYVKNLWINAYASVISMASSFIFIFLCIFITNLIIIKKLKFFFKEEDIKPIKLPNYSLAFIVAIIGAVLTKNYLYQNALVFLKAVMFNVNDPIFGKDFGYYLFLRPFLIAVSDYISGTWLVVVLYTIGYYVLAFGSIFNAVDIESVKKYGVFNHNLINIAIFFIIRTATFNFGAESILYSKNKLFYGAGFTDVNVWLKVNTIAPFVLAAVVITAFIFLSRNKLKKALITIAVYPAFWITSMIIAAVVQLVVVMPNEVAKEKSYISNSIELTKFAYNLSDKLEEKNFYVSDSLNSEILDANKITINNLPLVSKSAILESANQLQEYRNYYSFQDTDIIKYDVNGNTIAAYSSARELDKKGIDEKSYENVRFRYTHGYGAVINSVFQVDKDGRPEYITKDIPLTYPIKGTPQIKRPQIYFGENTKDHIIVNLKGSKGMYESDFPTGERENETIYSGKAGVTLTPINRVLMSFKLADPRMLFSGYIDSQSKVLINREIIARAKMIAPFLDIDKNPYLVTTSDGKLNWIVDAYTESAYFPYSKPVTLEKNRKINYMRNSVKIIIDAYDGTMKFYIIDRSDPIIRTYERIYPHMFEAGPIPNEIVDQIKYSEKMIDIQANILQKYHMNDVSQFANNEDLWTIAVQPGKDKDNVVEPYYTLVKYPDAAKPELVLMIPFTQKNRNNLAGWLSVRSNAYNYGKMTLYKIPRNSLVYGPTQIETFIDQDPNFLKDQEILSQGNATIVRGRQIILPLEDESGSTLLYVEPIYTVSGGDSAIPQLKRVAVFYQGIVIIDETLDKALQKLLISLPESNSITPDSIGNKELINKLISVYGEMKNFSAINDWENFGKKMNELDSIIAEINQRKDEIK